MIPLYLRAKLAKIGITSLEELIDLGYLKSFHYLKLTFPSISFTTLFDLFCICSKLKISDLDTSKKNDLRLEYKRMPHYYPLIPKAQINYFMDLAFEQAIIAQTKSEIPIGAIIVKNQQIIASGYNQTLTTQKITQHAEIVAIENAVKILGSHRLNECDLYVTVEPCLMCSGAIIHSRIQRLIFGSTENKTGSVVSQYKAFDNLNVNHHTEIIGPVNQATYIKPLQEFLNNKR